MYFTTKDNKINRFHPLKYVYSGGSHLTGKRHKVIPSNRTNPPAMNTKQPPDQPQLSPSSASITTKVLIGLFIFFSCFLGGMIWWFEFHWKTTFDPIHVSFSGSALPLAPGKSASNKPLVVHFIDPDCTCNRFSEPHINHLSIYALRNTTNRVVYSHPPPERRLLLHELENNALVKKLLPYIPASPAVAIWDKHGSLAYFGPYSSGAICGRGDDLVQYTLDNLKRGDNPSWTNQEVVGCYCHWPN